MTIPGVDSITFDATVIPPSCWGESDGEIQFTNISGEEVFFTGSPYTIEFDASASLPNGLTMTYPVPAGQNLPDSLLSGSYTFTITSSNGCILTMLFL